MHRLYFLSFAVVTIFIIINPSSAQKQVSNLNHFDERPPDYVSIHQWDLERHRDYVVESKPSEIKRVAQPLQQRSRKTDKVVFGYHPYWMGDAYVNYSFDLLTTIAYFGVEVTSTGGISETHGWPATGLIDKAHSNGVKVVLVAINFDRSSISTLLGSSTYRTRLINNLVSAVASANADGVNIDFEGLSSSSKAQFTAFIQELGQTFHNEIPGSEVTIAMPAVDWSNAYDYQALAAACDGLFIMGYNYHWTGSNVAGPVSPLTGWGTYNISWTIQDYLTKTGGMADKLILGVPYYSIQWPTTSGSKGASTRSTGRSMVYSSAEPQAQSYGKKWDDESQTPWYCYNSGGWYQCWYDDSLSLGKKYDLALTKGLLGVGIWALGYDGTRPELWGALADKFGAAMSPLAVTHLSIQNVGQDVVVLEFSESKQADTYYAYASTDGETFRIAGSSPTPQILLTDLSPDNTYFFKVIAANANGESPSTEVLGCRPSIDSVRVLVVNGFDRMSTGGNTRDFIIQHGSAIANAGYAFDSCSNEAIINGQISLTQYDIVDWILGEESTANETFSNVEQDMVKEFLRNGGSLFVSGSEIGWDLEAKGTSSDIAFYHTYLKARYVKDQVLDYTVDGVDGSIFAGLSFSYDDGIHGTYSVSYPDGIAPYGDSQECLKYNSTYTAGVQYAGKIGGTEEARLVNLGFPFETIYPESVRNQVMSRALTFLDVDSYLEDVSSSTEFHLWQNYPNPFNNSTTIQFYVPRSVKVNLTIYNQLGQVVRRLLAAQTLSTGLHSVIWDGRSENGQSVGSGLYFFEIEADDFRQTKKMVLTQ